MAKELKGALNALLSDQPEKKQAEKKSESGEIRATMIVDKEKMDKLKSVAFHNRLLIKEVIDSAFDKYITAYEKKHGKIEAIPEKKNLPI